MNLSPTFAGFVENIEATDVEATDGHLPSVHRSLFDYVVHKLSGLSLPQPCVTEPRISSMPLLR